MPPQTIDWNELVQRLENVRNHAVETRNDLRLVYEHLPLNDPRVVVARHLKAIASSCYLSAIYLSDSLSYGQWWALQFRQPIDRATTQDEVDDYFAVMTWNLLILGFSLFEAGLRRVVRAMDPAAVGGGTGPFKSVCSWMLRRLRTTGWSYVNADEFLDLLRLLRNTIHNNSFHYPPDGRAVSIDWKGRVYEFRPGESIDFITLEFREQAMIELVELNRSIMLAPAVKALPIIGD